MYIFIKENSRWLLAGFLLTFFSSYGQTFFISIWGGEIRGEYNLSHGDFGILYMGATLLSAVAISYVGKFVDSIKISTSAWVTILILAAACFGMASSQNLFVLFVVIFLLRLFGQGMMSHIAITAMGRWYSRNRGKAVAVAGTGYQVAEGIVPIIFFFVVLFFHWRMAWVISGISLLCFALPVVLWLLKENRVPNEMVSEKHKKNIKHWQRGEVLADKWFWLLLLGILSPPFMGTSIWFHQAYLIEVNGWLPQVWYSSFVVLAVATISASIITGLAIDRFTAIKMLAVFAAPLGVSSLLLGMFSSQIMIFIIMFALGVSHGMTLTIFGAIWPEIYGTKHLGAIRAVAMAAMVFASAAGPGLTGYLIDAGVGFKLQLIYFAVYCFLCVPLMYYAGRKILSRKFSQWQH